eukprot:gene34197-41395_t
MTTLSQDIKALMELGHTLDKATESLQIEQGIVSFSFRTVAVKPALPPIEKFRQLLPVELGLTEELENLIIYSYSSRLLTVNKPEDAINLYEVANNHPRMSTRKVLEDEHDLAVDGNFEFNFASAKATLVRAFSKTTGTPYLLKFGPDVHTEHESFAMLGLSEEQSQGTFIVPMVLIQTVGHRSALRLSVMHCSLDIVPCLKEELVLRRISENIVPALNYMHERDLFHMDVKPGNILIGPGDCWFLCDLGSAVAGEGTPIRTGLTPAYIPRDLRRIAENKFDFTLLVICTILKVLPKEFTRFNELPLKEVKRAVQTKLTSLPLKDFCLNLLA